MNIFALIKQNIKSVLFGTLISLLTVLIFIIIEAVLMCSLELDNSFAYILSSVALAIGSFSGGFFTAFKVREKGMIFGITVAVIVYLLFMISAIPLSNSFSYHTLINGIITLLSGAIGGIIGVNTGTRNKII